MLGHDSPKYPIDFEFLFRMNLWIHCKDYKTLQKMVEINKDNTFHIGRIELNKNLNFFYHTTEDYTLTSFNLIWAHPNKYGGRNTICVLPEMYETSTEGYAGICSDYIEVYRND